jgi:hypothetical protein
MAFVNLYHPSSPSLPPADPYGPDPYDLNFCLPIPAVLSTSLIKLIPLVPRAHADAIWAAGGSDQSLYRHILFPMRTKNEFLERLQGFQKDTGRMMWLIVDLTKEEDPVESEVPRRGRRGSLGGRIAGWLGYGEAKSTHQVSMPSINYL